jgi:hypothetical protein
VWDEITEEVERGKVGGSSVGAQHVGTGMGLGGMKGRRLRLAEVVIVNWPIAKE